MNWKISQDYYKEEEITKNGNKYLTGNGYLGIRGTLQEYDKSQYPAINLSGIYDRYKDGWREPLNAPNGLYTYVIVDGTPLKLPEQSPVNHSQELDMRHGIFERTTTWEKGGKRITVHGEQFASMSLTHLIGLKYSVTADCDCDLSIVTGVDGDVWDIHGPHYKEAQLSRAGNQITGSFTTNEGSRVFIGEEIFKDFEAEENTLKEEKKMLRRLSIKAKKGRTYVFTKYVCIFTSNDAGDPCKEGKEFLDQNRKYKYEALRKESEKAWESLWDKSEIQIEGDDEAMTAINYSIYHLHCIAPRHGDSLSIPARGLSGQTYKGAIFWDTEMFMLDLFLYTEPEVVRTLLKYRVDTLKGALKKAAHYGYQGAFYAWESQEGGYDACTDYNVTDVFTGRPVRTYFKDKQVHISSAIVYGIMKYVDYTKDYGFLREGGAQVVIECARFYLDLLVKKVFGTKYEIHDVIGPDEYHERVNNNAYTNRMAKFTLESALSVIEKLKETDIEAAGVLNDKYDLNRLTDELKDAVRNIYIKMPGQNGVIEQFDGYSDLEDIQIEDLQKRILNEKEYWGGANGIASHTKVIKQADVVTMLNLFKDEYSGEVKNQNFQYYEPRTEHGSSLSACMYAILACQCNKPEEAYPFFLKTAKEDLKGGGKEWAGLVYIGGTHPAAAGGAYKTVIEGFGGFRIEEGRIAVHPHLPKKWTKLGFSILYNGQWNRIEIQGSNVTIKEI